MGTENNALLLTFLVLFIALGAVMPYIAAEFDLGTTIDTSGALTELSSADIGAGDVLASIATIFFWSWSFMPVWLNLILLVPRLIFWVIVYDKLRGI